MIAYMTNQDLVSAAPRKIDRSYNPYDPDLIFKPSPLPSPFPPPSRYFSGHSATSPTDGPVQDIQERRNIYVATWNVAAVNNNPFEYWITHDDPAYNRLMDDVQDFLDQPGQRDVPVSDVFTHQMFEELMHEMSGVGMQGLETVGKFWWEDYSKRPIISGFIKDTSIGKKRLASMPDRITNTITTAHNGVVRRPTVINHFDGDLPSLGSWWKQWREFMFRSKVQVFKGSKPAQEPQFIYELLDPIYKSKYPAITEEEEACSIPLQIVCLAIFDAILNHMLSVVAPDTWQQIRRSIGDALLRNKDKQTASVLAETYAETDVIFLQEASGAFVKGASAQQLSPKFSILLPPKMDGKRDQNSIILVNRARFVEDSAVDITEEVMEMVTKLASGPSAKKTYVHGDLVVFRVKAREEGFFILASFHGDTNGLGTKPIVEALHATAVTSYPDHKLVVGLDANTYKVHSEQYQGVKHFHDFLISRGMASCWGGNPDPLRPTTCNARTYLQPQLNKAISRHNRLTKADKNLKDWIIFDEKQMEMHCTTRDNTGKCQYINDMVFPTMQFPSDHAVVASVLLLKR